MKKVAYIVEPRKHAALKFVLNNFNIKLPKEYTIQIFHSKINEDYIRSIVKDLSSSRNIVLYNLGVSSFTHEDESNMMRTIDFWQKIEGDIALKFECDTILCPQSKFTIDRFEMYPYIGGYWGSELYPINDQYPILKPKGDYSKPYNGPQILPMNGGISLRHKKSMIYCIENYLQEYINAGKPYSEDYFYSEYLPKPITRDVLQFSIDNGYIKPLNNELPFSLHKPWANKGNAYDIIRTLCPEVNELHKLQYIYSK